MSLKYINHVFTKFLAIAIASGYILASTPLHLHDDEHHALETEEHASALHPSDGCHNFIYHGQNNVGCKDHSHASKSEHLCLICHFFKAKQKLLLPKTLDEPNTVPSICVDDNLVQPIKPSTLKKHGNRGPPVLV